MRGFGQASITRCPTDQSIFNPFVKASLIASGKLVGPISALRIFICKARQLLRNLTPSCAPTARAIFAEKTVTHMSVRLEETSSGHFTAFWP